MTTDSNSAQFDRDGFLKDPNAWSEDLAREIAARDGLGELSDEQWQIVRALRQYWNERGVAPSVAHVCEMCAMDRHCIDRLFNRDERQAWRIAGLPNPGEEAKAYM